jgi:hypothetical protein
MEVLEISSSRVLGVADVKSFEVSKLQSFKSQSLKFHSGYQSLDAG